MGKLVRNKCYATVVLRLLNNRKCVFIFVSVIKSWRVWYINLCCECLFESHRRSVVVLFPFPFNRY